VTRPPQFDFASLLSQIQVPGHAQGGLIGQHAPAISLHDLLSPANTIRSLDTVSQTIIDNLIANLPPAIVPKDATVDQKKAVIAKVLRSPQFSQSSIGLTVALREGGLMGVADSLRVPIEPGVIGLDQVELFIKGVKKEVEKESGSEM
jgi:26S proteasome regulatory subunit N13